MKINKVKSVRVIVEFPIKEIMEYERRKTLKNGEWVSNSTEQHYRALCKILEGDIKRHCDFDGDLFSEIKTVDVCSFCGREWETLDNGQPLCCEKAVIEWEIANENT